MDTIEITKENGPIPTSFEMTDLKDMNVIVGKNNTGKTKFFEAVEKQYKRRDDIKVIYITARDVKPEDELKTSADSSNFIKNLEEISAVLGYKCNIPKKIIKDYTDIVNEANTIFQSITGETSKLTSTTRTTIDPKWVIRSAIKTNTGDITKEGQGHQRLAIASFLNACANRVSNLGLKSEILILFEEPELYLHPELKKELNKILRNISQKNKYQVIISTHDPYFLWANMNDENVQTYSFKIDDGKTVVSDEVGLGVEDEMLFITLYNKVLKTHGGSIDDLDTKLRSGHSSDIIDYKKCDDECGETLCRKTATQKSLVTYIRHQIHHSNNVCNAQYTPKQLEKAISILAKEI